MDERKIKGRAWAYIASDWRSVKSTVSKSPELLESLAGKGYVTAEYNKGVKPARRPTRREVLSARGVWVEEAETHGE